ncbi:MAG TPA: PEP-CTERM sorting domain-containing protein [Burkholderiaceae bacterium]
MKKIALAALLAASFGAHAAVITFDGLNQNGTVPIANGYAGLNWSDFYTTNAPVQFPGSGYAVDTISGEVAYNGYAQPATISATSSAGFTLNSGYFAAAWINENAVFTARFEDGSTATKTFAITTGSPVFETFGWHDLASVTMVGDGGSHIAVENLNAAAVPEPAETSLLLAGLGAIALVARRRKQA